MPLTFFNMLDEICTYKSDLDFDDPEIDKAYNIYMINRYLSMIEYFIQFVHLMNHAGVEKRDHYQFFKSIIPKNEYRFPYIKKEEDIDNEEAIKYLCPFFDIGIKEAKMYIPLLKKEHITELKKIYAYGKNGKSNAADAEFF